MDLGSAADRPSFKGPLGDVFLLCRASIRFSRINLVQLTSSRTIFKQLHTYFNSYESLSLLVFINANHKFIKKSVVIQKYLFLLFSEFRFWIELPRRAMWVEIYERGERMFANLSSGECQW